MTTARVVRTLNMQDGPGVTESVERATNLNVSEGHLVVSGYTDDGSLAHLAVYSPSEWKWAELVSDSKR